MAIDVRPPRGAFTVFDVDCVVMPQGWAQYDAKVSRVAPSGAAPNIEAAAVVVDTNPRFSFWKSDLHHVMTVGDEFSIAEGFDAGGYSVERVDDLDGEVVEVVATRRW